VTGLLNGALEPQAIFRISITSGMRDSLRHNGMRGTTPYKRPLGGPFGKPEISSAIDQFISSLICDSYCLPINPSHNKKPWNS
jgi:hypothetical protein